MTIREIDIDTNDWKCYNCKKEVDELNRVYDTKHNSYDYRYCNECFDKWMEWNVSKHG